MVSTRSQERDPTSKVEPANHEDVLSELSGNPTELPELLTTLFTNYKVPVLDAFVKSKDRSLYDGVPKKASIFGWALYTRAKMEKPQSGDCAQWEVKWISIIVTYTRIEKAWPKYDSKEKMDAQEETISGLVRDMFERLNINPPEQPINARGILKKPKLRRPVCTATLEVNREGKRQRLNSNYDEDQDMPDIPHDGAEVNSSNEISTLEKNQTGRSRAEDETDEEDEEDEGDEGDKEQGRYLDQDQDTDQDTDQDEIEAQLENELNRSKENDVYFNFLQSAFKLIADNVEVPNAWEKRLISLKKYVTKNSSDEQQMARMADVWSLKLVISHLHGLAYVGLTENAREDIGAAIRAAETQLCNRLNSDWGFVCEGPGSSISVGTSLRLKKYILGLNMETATPFDVLKLKTMVKAIGVIGTGQSTIHTLLQYLEPEPLMLDGCLFVDEADAIYASLRKLQCPQTCQLPWTGDEIYSFHYLRMWVQTFHLRISDEEQREIAKGFLSTAMKVLVRVLEDTLGVKKTQAELLKSLDYDEERFRKQQQVLTAWSANADGQHLTLQGEADLIKNADILKMFQDFITDTMKNQMSVAKSTQRLRSKRPDHASTHLLSPPSSPIAAQGQIPVDMEKNILDGLTQFLDEFDLTKSESIFANSVQILADRYLTHGQDIPFILQAYKISKAKSVRTE